MGFESTINNPLTYDTRNLLHPNLPESLSIEFCRATVHAATQAPVNGVVQLGDKLLGTDVLPHVQFINPCDPAPFLSKRWHAQQFGSILGAAANILVLQKCVGKVGDSIFGHVENTAAHQYQLAVRSVQEAAVTGFIQNALFKAVDPSEGDFYDARLRNGLVGAGTWATLQAGALGVKRMGRGQDNILGAVLRSEIGSTVLSGVPGGIVQAELKSLLNNKGFADRALLTECVYTQSILGGAWAGGKQVIGGTRSENHLSTHMKIASLIARGKDLPPFNLDNALPTSGLPINGIPSSGFPIGGLPINSAKVQFPSPPIYRKMD